MAEPGALDYFYGTEAEQYTFYRIPKVLFTDPGFRRITADAKILYGLMLDRMGLSIRNNWLDEQERVFIYFTLEEAMDAMCCGHNKAVSLFTELDKVGLIERKKQGQGRPTKIYVKNFIRKEEVKTSENRKSALPESGTLDFRKSDTINTDNKKTDLSDTDPSIYPAARPPEDRPPMAADTMDTIRAYFRTLRYLSSLQKSFLKRPRLYAHISWFLLSRACREQEFCHQRLYYGSGNEIKQKFPCNVSGKGGVDTAEMPALRLRKDILEMKQGGEIIVRHFGEDLLLNEWALFSMKVCQCQGVLQVLKRCLDSPAFVVKRAE